VVADPEKISVTAKLSAYYRQFSDIAFASEVAALIAEQAFEDLDAPIRRLTAPDVPVPFSPSLEQRVLPGLDDMKEAIRELAAY